MPACCCNAILMPVVHTYLPQEMVIYPPSPPINKLAWLDYKDMSQESTPKNSVRQLYHIKSYC